MPASEADRFAMSSDKELEIMVAEMEHRVRGTVLKIIRPALDNILDLNSRIEEVRLEIRSNSTVTESVSEIRASVWDLSKFPEELSSRISALEDKANATHTRIVEQLGEMKVFQEAQERRIEDQQSDLQKQIREAPRIWEEVARHERNAAQDFKKVWDHLTASADRERSFQREMLESIHELHRLRDALREEVRGEGKGLEVVKQQMLQLQKAIEPIPLMEKEMQHALASVREVIAQQQSIAEDVGVAREHMNNLFRTMEQKLNSFRDDYHRSSNHMVSHHASLMRDIRNDYAAEMAYAREAREAVAQFQDNVSRFCHTVSDELKNESQRIDVLNRELSKDIEDVQQRRLKDLLDLQEQMEASRLAAPQMDSLTELRSDLESVVRLLGIVLDSERVVSALQVQDYADRCGERWLCAPSDQSRAPQPPLSVEDLENQRLTASLKDTSGSKALGAHGQEELVPVDPKKGLPCSGYTPGRIAFNGGEHDRRELLILYHRLWHKAQTVFRRLPQGTQDSAHPDFLPPTRSVLLDAGPSITSHSYSVTSEHHVAPRNITAASTGGEVLGSTREYTSTMSSKTHGTSTMSFSKAGDSQRSAAPNFGPKWQTAPATARMVMDMTVPVKLPGISAALLDPARKRLGSRLVNTAR